MLLGEAGIARWGTLLAGVNLRDKPQRTDSSFRNIFPLSYLDKRSVTAEVEGCRCRGTLAAVKLLVFSAKGFFPMMCVEDERQQVFLFFPRNSVNLFHRLIFFIAWFFSTSKP